jgi:hypothetical protein
MNHNTESPQDYVRQMVFAEQRLLAMCAKKMGIKIYEIMKFMEWDDNFPFTHVWGEKDSLRKNFLKRKDFCKRGILKIIRYFPDWDGRIRNIFPFEKYGISNPMLG